MAHRPEPRIQVLSSALADQIAAGEVVERPASVVKELVENSVDAGAGRIDVELEGGGLERIRVLDDGRGIHPDDLELALTRHATSKIRTAGDLDEIHTLGFRGEALASIAAVARVEIRSRPAEAERGTVCRVAGSETLECTPLGMPVGTQVEVAGLFVSVPARRKFMRSQATEVGHCSDAVLRVALVHPSVHFTLRHDARVLVELPACEDGARVEQVLGRRSEAMLHHVAGAHEGVEVRGWLGAPEASTRSTSGIYLVVRRRVVRERSLGQILSQVFGAWLEPGYHPLACLIVQPPPATVDVNVHPQKAEVRFRDPQRVYAAVRHVLAEGLAGAPWVGGDHDRASDASASAPEARARDALEDAPRAGRAYSLSTRALSEDYAGHKRAVQAEVEILRAAREPREPAMDPVAESTGEPGPTYLGCLPGPVGLFQDGGELVAVDLRALRNQLVHRRLVRELGGAGIVAQALLSPVVVERPRADVELCAAAREDLRRLGVELEAFGADSVIVRAVPAHLRSCVDEADVADLVDRIVPWLRLRARDAGDERGGPEAGLVALAATRGRDPAPRLARRWLAELAAEGVALEDVEGVRRWPAAKLVEPHGGGR